MKFMVLDTGETPSRDLRLLPTGDVARWGLHLLVSAAYSRRTPIAVICNPRLRRCITVRGE